MKDKLKQLQLGNYVLVQHSRLEKNTTPRVSKVSCISTESIKVNNKAVRYYNFEFIPITEEWLVKLGFKVESYGYLLKVSYIFKQYGKGYEFEMMKLDDYDFYIKDLLVHIKYVHELQNLFLTCFKIILWHQKQ